MSDIRILSLDILGKWTERWRYPELLEILGAGVELDTRRAVESMLDGLAAPPSSPRDTVRRLVGRGEFAVAEDLLADAHIFDDSFSDEDFTELHGLIDKARQQATVDLHREIRELSERARRCYASPSSLTDLDTTVQRSLEVARRRLTKFRDDIETVERELTSSLRDELDSRWLDAPDSWRASVGASLSAREFGVVRRQLADGPDADEFAGPVAVPRLRPDRWPWSERRPSDVLGWYQDSPAPAGFAQWAPPPDDNRARRLVAAMAAVSSELTRDTVREFAAALDGLLGVDEVTYSVAPLDGGFRTFLSGLGDPRLPHLRLQGRIRLWVAPGNWRPPDDDLTVGVWFLPEGSTADRAARTAVIEPAALFEIIAPDRDGRPTDSSTRRINLLRTICRQLAPDDVLPAGEFTTRDDDSRLSDDLRWAFDLLGVDVEQVVLDALRYDTGDHPAALWTAVRTIVAGRDGTPRFTPEELAAWRHDTEVRQQVRDAVLAPLKDDLAPLLAMYVVLFVHGSEGGASEFTDGELYDWIHSFLTDVGLGYELDNLFDMPGVLSRAAVTGLFEPLEQGRYRLQRPGLIALLSGDDLDTIIRSTVEKLRREGGLLVSRATVNVLLAHQRASSHLIGNRLYDTRSILSRLQAHQDTEVRALADQVLNHLEPIDGVREELHRPDLRRLLRPEPVDVVRLVDELRRQMETQHGGVQIEVVGPPDTAPVPMVRVRRALLRLALENVLSNAVRSIMDSAAEGPDVLGTVRVQVSVSDRARDCQVVIDVEDSGPGFSTENHRKASAGIPFTTREGGQGVGLLHTQESLEIDQGGLLVLQQPSERLGGAHVRIMLPCSAPR